MKAASGGQAGPSTWKMGRSGQLNENTGEQAGSQAGRAGWFRSRKGGDAGSSWCRGISQRVICYAFYVWPVFLHQVLFCCQTGR